MAFIRRSSSSSDKAQPLQRRQASKLQVGGVPNTFNPACQDVDALEWSEEAYGPQANLMECKFRWVKMLRVQDADMWQLTRRASRWKVGGQQDFPKYVRGEYVVAPRWQGAGNSAWRR